MKIVEVAFTGYPVTDMERARAFYEDILKLEPSRIFANGQWIEYDLGPSTFALSNMAQEKWKPSSDGPAVAFEVDDFDSAVKALRAGNVKFLIEPFESPVCRMAIIADRDGNSVAIHKRNVG
ncbi:MAG: VOC family protein [Verrucomicrobia bacterium]|nr:VOC family protein [Verrucomicrobiota bacterium]MBV9300041.1 VOC family protein [Verrucomicrobiota bacterium]MBV9642228.1 VOC family protein [Verrucomicrobiota bacterium]